MELLSIMQQAAAVQAARTGKLVRIPVWQKYGLHDDDVFSHIQHHKVLGLGVWLVRCASRVK
jgi:hypothetical protein